MSDPICQNCGGPIPRPVFADGPERLGAWQARKFCSRACKRSMRDSVLREIFVAWPAWQELHGHLLTTDPRTSDPHDLIGPLCAYGIDRAACLLYAHHIGSCLADSHAIVVDLLTGAREGKRPRYGAELGLRAADFGVTP